LPVLKKNQPSYDSIYGAYTMTQRMLRKGDWKLILYPKLGKTLLYNLDEDPQETNDVSGNPKHAALIKDLIMELKAWQPKTGDSLDLDNRNKKSNSPKKPKKKANQKTAA